MLQITEKRIALVPESIYRYAKKQTEIYQSRMGISQHVVPGIDPLLNL